MIIDDFITSRGISEILHFTTNKGIVGILDSRNIKSRQRIQRDERLEYILQPNASLRKDQAWLDYVNLSISQINHAFFNICSQEWHAADSIWWCILSFDPVILTHEGVYFTTTNNIYTGVKRGTGLSALEALFAQKVLRYNQFFAYRKEDTPLYQPTCEQAEVLYPRQLSTEYLRTIYVSSDNRIDAIQDILGGVNHRDVSVVVRPDKFSGIVC